MAAFLVYVAPERADQPRRKDDARLSGQTFFFYGSLMDVELLEAVLGRRADGLSLTPGWLSGYVAEIAERYSFPLLVEGRANRAHGVVVKGLSAADVERIAYFEDTEYAVVAIDVATAAGDVSARTYMATATLKSSGKRWDFDAWRKRDKPLLLAVTRKVMAEHYGVTPMAEIDAVWHRIKAEMEAELHAPIPLKARQPKPKRPSRTAAPTRAAPRRAKRAASPTRPPRGS
jgi:hypothetical protein